MSRLHLHTRPASWSRRGWWRADEGRVSGFVVVLTIGVLALAGLTLDGGSALAAKVKATGEAEAAARAGAQAIDLAAYRTTGTLHLVPEQAVADAHAYLATVGASGIVTVAGDTVTVTITAGHATQLLGLVGISGLTVHGSGSARPQRGITAGLSGSPGPQGRLLRNRRVRLSSHSRMPPRSSGRRRERRMVTSDEIERRVEQSDAARSAKRSAAAKRVGELAQRRAAVVAELSDLERELGEVLAEAQDVIDVNELARFTELAASDLTRWLTARTSRKSVRTNRKKSSPNLNGNGGGTKATPAAPGSGSAFPLRQAAASQADGVKRPTRAGAS